MDKLLDEIESYWSTRAEGYSEVNEKELKGIQKRAWLETLERGFFGKRSGKNEDSENNSVEKEVFEEEFSEKQHTDKYKDHLRILDIGTGPGFFPMILAEAGYHVTAIDYTPGMLEKAAENAAKFIGEKSRNIEFKRMDAQALEFEDESFDVIISRNLTWNLPHPEMAYKEWLRVLKKGGKLLNFDANWYGYLYDDKKREAYENDRKNVEKGSLDDHYLCTDIDRMEKIALQVPLSETKRPGWDVKVLEALGAAQIQVNEDIWQQVWSEEEKLNWLRQILEWQRDMSDNREFMSLLKNDLDLFADSVYCFTPQGDVKTLPNGSTPIDFAYSVHSAVGNKMVGARVNGKLVPIEYKIKNGDRIEIITSQNSQGPSRDWLKIVKSTQAKNKINQWFKKELKEDNILKGKDMLNQYAKTKGFKPGIYTKPQYMESVMHKYGFRDWDSVLAAIGHGGLKEGQVFNKLVEAYEREHKKNLTDEQVLEAASESQEKLHIAKSKSGIVVKGIHDVAVRFSKCCSPIPGDEIVGFVTRGRGITIHRTDCVNVLNMPEIDRKRLIEAEWQMPDRADSEKYEAEIQVYANNRTGLLVDISKIFTERKIDLRSINSRTNKQERATISMSFNVCSKQELNSLIEKIRQVESVLDVERTTG